MNDEIGVRTLTNMPAGRELDALVAEKVMGGPENNVQWYWWNNSNPSLQIGLPLFAGPSFSTDIAAAWLVVEKVQAEPFEFAFQMQRTPVISSRWIVFMGTAALAANTAPLAICRASLLAITKGREL